MAKTELLVVPHMTDLLDRSWPSPVSDVFAWFVAHRPAWSLQSRS
jgi:hypothetical protein